MKKTFKSITSYLKGLFLFPYYSYKSYKILKTNFGNNITNNSLNNQIKQWNKSIADIKGNIVDNYIEINGIKIKNSFK